MKEGVINRPDQKTFKVGCPAFVKLSFASKWNQLKITECSFVHNHPLNEDDFKFFPENRNRLPKDCIDLIETAENTHGSRKHVLHQLQSKFSEGVQAKDLHNFIQKSQSEKFGADSTLQKVLRVLDIENDKDPRSACILTINENSSTSRTFSLQNCVKPIDVIFFKNSKMRLDYEKFGQFSSCDGTYSLNDHRYVLYVFLAFDSSRQGRVVAFALLSNEDQEHVQAAFEEFKLRNSSCINETQTVLVDKQLTEIQSVSNIFLKARILLCKVHTERNFKLLAKECDFHGNQLQEILKRGQSIDSVRSDLLEILYGLLKSRSIRSLEDGFALFLADPRFSDTFKSNFRQNWWNIKEMWAECHRKNVLNFDIGDTNHIENKNREIKQHFQSKFPSMLDCIQNLLIFRDLHQNRSDFKDFKNRMTVSRLVQNSNSEIVKLSHHLCTKTAADLIIHQHYC